MVTKNALIIGGSGGIGLETAKTLYNKKINVHLTYYKNHQKTKEKMKEIGMEDSNLFQMNLNEEESVNESILSLLKKIKTIDYVIYCVSSPIFPKRIFNLPWNEFNKHINVQIKGLHSVINSLSDLIKSNHKIKFIVLITEACIGKPPSMLSPYITAKYGLMGFVKCMVSELSSYNCTFNMISPGMVSTKLISNFPPMALEIAAKKNPLRRISEPKDVANLISFLVSEESNYCNEVNIPLNGGSIFI